MLRLESGRRFASRNNHGASERFPAMKVQSAAMQRTLLAPTPSGLRSPSRGISGPNEMICKRIPMHPLAAASSDNEAKSSSDASASAGPLAWIVAWFMQLQKRIKRWLTDMYIMSVSTEEGIYKLVKRFPSKVQSTFDGLFQCYKRELVRGVGDEAEGTRLTIDVFKKMIRAYAEQFEDPYEFPSYHSAMRTPWDYYDLGNQYTGQMVDYKRSVVKGAQMWDKIVEWTTKGENVVLLGNHQSEADAAFIPLLTKKSHPGLGEKVIYVAGSRVVSDIMSKPFSMGRNLLCVHSKKYMMEGDRAAKMKQNVKTLKEMERLFREGGKIVWIAPSGGRDRRKADGVLLPDNFDPSAVEMMRKIGTKAGLPKTHYVPFSMQTYDIMPPPTSVGGEIGEVRLVNFTGVGLGLGEEVDVSDGEWTKGLAADADASARADALTAYIQARVVEDYKVISEVVAGDPSSPLPKDCSRPW